MSWETIAAAAAAVTAVVGAIAAVTGQLGKAWTAGRRWRRSRTVRRVVAEAAGDPEPRIPRVIGPQRPRREGRAVVWIIYRREDTAGTAKRLHTELVRRRGRENVLIDPEPDDRTAKGEERFLDVARRSDIALVLIGLEWLRSEDEFARSRLWDPTDLVHDQIAAAFAADIAVVPILVRGASMPFEHQLPQDISSLATMNVMAVTPSDLEQDVTRVAELVENWETG